MKTVLSGIYKIVNTVNGKVYVGSSVNIPKRKKDHFWDLENGRHANSHLQNAFNKYGIDSFSFEIIETCDKDKLIEREQHYMDSCASYDERYGYNIRKIADSNSGVKRSDESKKKQSDRMTGIKKNNFRDKSIRLFVNKDGEIEKLSAYDLCQKYNISSALLGAVIQGRNLSAKGWYLDKIKQATMPNCLYLNSAQIRSEYERGVPAPTLCKKYSVYPGTIRKHVLKAGGKMRGASTYSKRIISSEIRSEYEAGASTTELSKKYKVSISSIIRYLGKADTKIRTRVEGLRLRSRQQKLQKEDSLTYKNLKN